MFQDFRRLVRDFSKFTLLFFWAKTFANIFFHYLVEHSKIWISVTNEKYDFL